MRTLGLALLVLVLATGRAEAGWYFGWECFDAACANGHLSGSGVEGPFASAGDCWHARGRKGFELNSDGGYGGTGECYDADSAGAPGTGGAGVSPARAAQLARVYVSAIYAPPWRFTYGDASEADSGAIAGGEIEFAVGHERLGLELSIGALRASGPPARTGRPEDVIWAFTFGIGLHSSPVALVRRKGLEIRPDLGVAVADVGRLSCEACAYMINMKSEPTSALGLRARVGLDVYLGRRRATGIGVDAMYQPLTMKSDDDPTAPFGGVDTRIDGPTWWLRVSLLRRGRRYAAY